jgi:hypothetical protein
MLCSGWVGPAAAIRVLASSDRVTWYTAELISVAKQFNFFHNHSLSLAKLQNVTALHRADSSVQNVDMSDMQQLKASEEGVLTLSCDETGCCISKSRSSFIRNGVQI